MDPGCIPFMPDSRLNTVFQHCPSLIVEVIVTADVSKKQEADIKA